MDYYNAGPLPESISQLVELEDLRLSSNKLTTGRSGARYYETMTRLQILHLNDNELGGRCFELHGSTLIIMFYFDVIV